MPRDKWPAHETVAAIIIACMLLWTGIFTLADWVWKKIGPQPEPCVEEICGEFPEGFGPVQERGHK